MPSIGEDSVCSSDTFVVEDSTEGGLNRQTTVSSLLGGTQPIYHKATNEQAEPEFLQKNKLQVCRCCLARSCGILKAATNSVFFNLISACCIMPLMK